MKLRHESYIFSIMLIINIITFIIVYVNENTEKEPTHFSKASIKSNQDTQGELKNEYSYIRERQILQYFYIW